MLSKIFLVVLSVFLIGFVLLSGCIGINSNSSDNLPSNSSDLTSILSNPNATPQEVLDALAEAQKLGKDTPELDAQTKAFLQKWINDIIANPNATPEMLLNALSVAQAFVGDEDETYYNQVTNILKQKINSELQSQSLCKKRLLEIAQYSDLLGFDEYAEIAKTRANGLPDECGNTTVEYSEINESKSSNSTINATFRGTSMKLFAPGGFTMPDNKMYSLENGTVSYNYFLYTNDGCIETWRRANGTEKVLPYLEALTKYNTQNVAMGTLGLDNTGKYSGNFSVTIDVTVKESKKPFVPTYPEQKDPCQDVKIKPVYTEKVAIATNFEGVISSNENKIANTDRQEDKSEDYSSDIITIWNLTLEN